MGLFDRKKKKVQATEGLRNSVDITDGLTWARSSGGIPGLANQYITYSSQIDETYKKYNGTAELGGASVRVIVDTRTAFIAGEGLSIAIEDEKVAAWIQSFLKKTRLSGSLFYDSVMGTECAGRALFILEPVPGTFPRLIRIPYNGKGYRLSADGRRLFLLQDNGMEREIPEAQFVYICTGGDDRHSGDPTTRVGLVLTDCENYERALRDIRLMNYSTSRITPTFETETDEETAALTTNLKASGWKIGQAFVGKAKFDYKNAGVGPLDNLKTELACEAKEISAVTGVPLHWFGWTDLMSNRATAEDLYQMIANATSRERTLLSEGMYDLIVKAQTLYINSGGTDLRVVDDSFTATIPSIDYGRFESLVRALSTALNDEAISIDDYRSFIPGIDPLATKRTIEAEKKAGMAAQVDDLLKQVEEDDEEAKQKDNEEVVV